MAGFGPSGDGSRWADSLEPRFSSASSVSTIAELQGALDHDALVARGTPVTSFGWIARFAWPLAVCGAALATLTISELLVPTPGEAARSVWENPGRQSSTRAASSESSASTSGFSSTPDGATAITIATTTTVGEQTVTITVSPVGPLALNNEASDGADEHGHDDPNDSGNGGEDSSDSDDDDDDNGSDPTTAPTTTTSPPTTVATTTTTTTEPETTDGPDDSDDDDDSDENDDADDDSDDDSDESDDDDESDDADGDESDSGDSQDNSGSGSGRRGRFEPAP